MRFRWDRLPAVGLWRQKQGPFLRLLVVGGRVLLPAVRSPIDFRAADIQSRWFPPGMGSYQSNFHSSPLNSVLLLPSPFYKRSSWSWERLRALAPCHMNLWMQVNIRHQFNAKSHNLNHHPLLTHSRHARQGGGFILFTLVSLMGEEDILL